MGKGINTRHRYVTLCDHAGVGVGWAVFARTVAIAHVHRSCGHSNGMAQKRKKFRAKRLAAQTSLADRGIVIEAPTPKLSKKRLRKLRIRNRVPKNEKSAAALQNLTDGDLEMIVASQMAKEQKTTDTAATGAGAGADAAGAADEDVAMDGGDGSKSSRKGRTTTRTSTRTRKSRSRSKRA